MSDHQQQNREGKKSSASTLNSKIARKSPTNSDDHQRNNNTEAPVACLEQSISLLVESSPSSSNVEEERNKSGNFNRHRSISRGRRRSGDSSSNLRRSVPRQNSNRREQEVDANERARRRRRSTSRRRSMSRHNSNQSLSQSSLKLSDDEQEGQQSLHRSTGSISSRASTRRSALRRLEKVNGVPRTSSTPSLSGHRQSNALTRSKSLLGPEWRSAERNANWNDNDDDESLTSKNNNSLADFLRQQNAAVLYNKSSSRRRANSSSSISSRSTQDPPAHGHSQPADLLRPESKRSDSSISELRKSLTEEYLTHSRRPVLRKASSKQRLMHSSVLDFFPLDTSCAQKQERIHEVVVQMGLVTEEQLQSIIAAGFHFSVTENPVPSTES